jgi:hypothetical protein
VGVQATSTLVVLGNHSGGEFKATTIYLNQSNFCPIVVANQTHVQIHQQPPAMRAISYRPSWNDLNSSMYMHHRRYQIHQMRQRVVLVRVRSLEGQSGEVLSQSLLEFSSFSSAAGESAVSKPSVLRLERLRQPL